ncbi:MAG TPA: SUMF1/EgtB/PvdO family nonheme iron enzyme [Flavobacteriales bacterium]|nr:SUMF1/EgtB/PvdO family nonheme iron enzyme [Flavobacteriales bacterium]
MKMISFTILSILLTSFATREYKSPYDLAFVEKNMAYIPAGTHTNAGSDQGLPLKYREAVRTITVERFHMYNHEVTNGLYVYYVNELRKKDTTAYRKALPDTAIWKTEYNYMEPYVQYYFRHPAYADYPVVGITHNQCLEFCKWLTNAYNTNPKRKFKKVEFDLPSLDQWEYAARGGLKMSPFPWGGPYMQNKKGEWLANFRQFSQSGIWREEYETTSSTGIKYTEVRYVASGGGGDIAGSPGTLNDAADITAPAKSYYPNDYKLYNMAGNVEEFVKEEGKTKGGSWRDSGYYLQNSVYEEYDPVQSASTERGFRFVMKVIEQ